MLDTAQTIPTPRAPRARPRPAPIALAEPGHNGDPLAPVDLAQEQKLLAAKQALRVWVQANKAKNDASKAEAEAEKALSKAMADAGISEVRVDDGTGYVEATEKPGEKTVVDMEALSKIVPFKDLKPHLSITQAAIKDNWGTAVFSKVSKTVATVASLKIRKHK